MKIDQTVTVDRKPGSEKCVKFGLLTVLIK